MLTCAVGGRRRVGFDSERDVSCGWDFVVDQRLENCGEAGREVAGSRPRSLPICRLRYNMSAINWWSEGMDVPAAMAFELRSRTCACRSSICFCDSSALSEDVWMSMPQCGQEQVAPAGACDIVRVMVVDMSTLSCKSQS